MIGQLRERDLEQSQSFLIGNLRIPKKLEIADKTNFKASRDTGSCFFVQKYTLKAKGRGRVT